MISIKGSVLRTRLSFVEELAPGDGTTRVLARLTSQERDVLGTILASALWHMEPTCSFTSAPFLSPLMSPITRRQRSWAA